MKTLIAFARKEALEHLRSGRLVILGLLFLMMGVMNPAVAKMTPWLLELMADSLAQSGMSVTGVTVTAMDAWVQFFKNMPMALIAFVLLESSIFTREYQSGTLVLALTRGLPRWQVVLAKTAVTALMWTAGHWMCYGVTYGYSAYFWDNAVAQQLPFSAVCWWVFGLWVCGLTTLFSVLARTNTGVLAGTGCTVLGVYLLSLLPDAGRYMPTQLMNGNALIYGLAEAAEYAPSMCVAGGMALGCMIAAVIAFDRKRL